MVATTLDGVILHDVFASRPAVGTVAKGAVFSATDTKVIYQSDGAAWNAMFDGSGFTSNPLTTTGDIIYSSSGTTAARLAIGTTGKFLTAGASTPAWGQGPLTTTGDLMLGATGGTPTRLAVGGATTVLHGGASAPAYSAVLPADLDVTADNATANATTGHHGLLPKLDSSASKYLDGSGAWSTPAGSALTVDDEGTPLATAATTLDFVGAGVVASGTGATKTITIAGGGSGLTVQYPALKPSPPTYDFDGASLDVAFSAHSSQGSFATGSCMTQGAEVWPGTALEMQFSEQMGGLYVTHADADLDFHVGGLSYRGYPSTALMIGIAALNSSGTGVGVVAYNDGNAYLATITTWGYAANSDSWSTHGLPGTTAGSLNSGPFWIRLKRVSGTWTAYMSLSGRAWDKTFSTRADSIVVDRLFVGMLYNTSTTYSGRLIADYFHVAV